MSRSIGFWPQDRVTWPVDPSWDHASRFYKVVIDDYVLQPGFEP